MRIKWIPNFHFPISTHNVLSGTIRPHHLYVFRNNRPPTQSTVRKITTTTRQYLNKQKNDRIKFPYKY